MKQPFALLCVVFNDCLYCVVFNDITCNTQWKYKLETSSRDDFLLQHRQHRIAEIMLQGVCIHFFRLLFHWNSVNNKMNIYFTSGIMNLWLRFILLFHRSNTILGNVYSRLTLNSKLSFCNINLNLDHKTLRKEFFCQQRVRIFLSNSIANLKIFFSPQVKHYTS